MLVVWCLYLGESHCDYYLSGSFTKSAGSNIDLTNRMEAAFINLKAQASYSSSTEVKFDVQAFSDVCGSNAGWAHADLVLAEQRRTRPLC